MMLDTRWPMITCVAPAVLRLSACRSRASVPVSRDENESSKMYSSGRFTSARAMASRCRCPPETLVPPCEMGASSPPSISSTKPRAWAISSASQHSSSVASGLPYCRLLRTVPLNR
jgi:hypothetical protein